MSNSSDIQSTHYTALGFSDWFALRITKTLRWGADTFFAKRYGNRAIVLETVAGVPGMVGATLSHLRALRLMQDDRGWIRTLMDEAENERMHLMTFIEIAQPSWFERLVILTVQWVFYIFFFFLYLISSKTAHRLVGYFEEEAVLSYTLYLAEIDEGRHPNPPAPPVAMRYWNLPEGTTLRDVILIIRADEAHHRDTNHYMANALSGRDANHKAIMACPAHVSLDAGLLLQSGVVHHSSGVMGGRMSTPAKLIIIFILLWVAVHLLLYGYLKRRIAAAKRDRDAEA